MSVNCHRQLFDRTKNNKNENAKQVNIISSQHLPAQYFIRAEYQLEESSANPKTYDQPEPGFRSRKFYRNRLRLSYQYKNATGAGD